MLTKPVPILWLAAANLPRGFVRAAWQRLKRRQGFLGAILLLFLSPLPGWAQSSNWTVPLGQAGDWSAPGNWTSGVPTASTTAYITNGGTATVTLPGATYNQLWLDGAAGSGALNMISGSLTGSDCQIGNTRTGTFTQSGGTNSVTGELCLGYNSSGNGTYNLSGTGILSSQIECAGSSGTGTFNQTGGTNLAYGLLYVGGGSNGAYNLSGPALHSASSEHVRDTAPGTFKQSGANN